MNDLNDPVRQGRASFLSMLMGVIAAVFFCVVMILITGGFFFYVVAAVGGLVMLGMFHYVLWGRSMDQEATAERQRQEVLDKVKENFTRGTNWNYRR